jgi:hypothetical protein
MILKQPATFEQTPNYQSTRAFCKQKRRGVTTKHQDELGLQRGHCHGFRGRSTSVDGHAWIGKLV